MIKKIIPRKLQTLVRFYSIFNLKHGHSSNRDGFCVNGDGEFIPWITYPCLEFLNNLDLSDCRVFEFGAGSSTLYWSKRVKSVSSVEREQVWFQHLEEKRPQNCEVRHCLNEHHYPKVIHDFEGQFDVVVVDGAVRFPCAQEALSKISERGIFILDNTEWYPNVAELFRSKGYTQIDFCGFPPVNAFTSCTSIFFKSPELLQKRKKLEDWRPVGGKYLVAHDDVPLDKINPANFYQGN